MTKKELEAYKSEAIELANAGKLTELNNIRATIMGQLTMLKDKLKNWSHDFVCEANFIIPGRWSNRGYKKMWGVKGEQIQEYEKSVLCAFPVEELITSGEKIVEVIDQVMMKD